MILSLSGSAESGPAVPLLLLLATAALVATIFRRLKLEAIPGYLVAGFLVGPVLGIVQHGEAIEQISSLATTLLMFVIGLSLEVHALRRGMVPILVVGALSTLVFVAGSTPVGLGFGAPLPQAIAMAMALSMSSTALLLRILDQRREMKAMIGRLCLGVSISQDLLSVIFLALLAPLAKWNQGTSSGTSTNVQDLAVSGAMTIGAIVALLLFGRFVLPQALKLVAKTASTELILIFSAATALAAAIAASLLRFSPELGAFMAGIMLASTPYKPQLVAQFSPLRDLLLPIFFTAVGLQVDTSMIADGWGRILLATCTLLLVKGMLLAVTSWALGASSSLAVLAGFYLWQGGEFSLVLLGQAGKSGLLPEDRVGRVIASVVLSLIVAPMLIEPGHRLARILSSVRPAPWIRRSAMREVAPPPSDDRSPTKGTVIVAGYGPVGREIADRLTHAGWAINIVELNPRTVQKQTLLGRSIVYGNVTSPEVLESAGIHHAACIVITVPSDEAAVGACQLARHMNRDILIAVRTSFLSHAIRAKEAGAAICVVEEVVTAHALAGDVLAMLRKHPSLAAVEQSAPVTPSDS